MTRGALRFRSRDPELMDAPDVAPEDLREALRQLAFINGTLGGISTTLAGLEALLPQGTRTFSFLDVGCGGGDTLEAVARFAKRRGMTAELHGIELSEVSAQMARERLSHTPWERGRAARTTGRMPVPLPGITVSVETANLFDLPPGPRYDIVHAALVLHHMSDDREVVRALDHMASLARVGVVINDLHRHPLAYQSIRLLTRGLSRNPLIRHDAPLSVVRSFTRKELAALAAEAGLQDVTIRWRWAFRWLLTARGVTG